MMKKRIIALFMTFMFIALFPQGYSYAEELDVTQNSAFLFPASLKIIDEEAFSETSLVKAVLPDGVTYIGNKAFHKAIHLKDIVIPKTTVYIGKLAIPQNEGLIIHTVKGSYAHHWAKEHHRHFVINNDKPLRNKSIQMRSDNSTKNVYNQTVHYGNLIRLHARTEDEGNSMRPQERPELYPIDYKFP